MDEFREEILLFHYLVISNEGFCNIYKSLRSITDDINVDFSTISKKMKENNGNFCFCKSKTTKTNFYIKKL